MRRRTQQSKLVIPSKRSRQPRLNRVKDSEGHAAYSLRPHKRQNAKLKKQLCCKMLNDLCCNVLRDVKKLNRKLKRMLSRQDDRQVHLKQEENDIFLPDHFGYTRIHRNFNLNIQKLLNIFNNHAVTCQLSNMKLVQYIMISVIDIYLDNINAKRSMKQPEAQNQQSDWVWNRNRMYWSCQQELIKLASVMSEMKFHPYYAKVRQISRTPPPVTEIIKITGLCPIIYQIKKDHKLADENTLVKQPIPEMNDHDRRELFGWVEDMQVSSKEDDRFGNIEQGGQAYNFYLHYLDDHSD